MVEAKVCEFHLCQRNHKTYAAYSFKRRSAPVHTKLGDKGATLHSWKKKNDKTVTESPFGWWKANPVQRRVSVSTRPDARPVRENYKKKRKKEPRLLQKNDMQTFYVQWGFVIFEKLSHTSSKNYDHVFESRKHLRTKAVGMPPHHTHICTHRVSHFDVHCLLQVRTLAETNAYSAIWTSKEEKPCSLQQPL